MNKMVEYDKSILKKFIKNQIIQEEKNLAEDYPEGTCASYHRGAIMAYNVILDKLDFGI